jgi:hypothetical protein
VEDFVEAYRSVKPTVTPSLEQQYVQFQRTFDPNTTEPITLRSKLAFELALS